MGVYAGGLSTVVYRQTIDGDQAAGPELRSTVCTFPDYAAGLDRLNGPFSIFVEGSVVTNATAAMVVRSFSPTTGNGIGLKFDDAETVTNGFYLFADNANHATCNFDVLGANSEQSRHRVMITGDGTNLRAYAKGALDKTTVDAATPTAGTNRATTVLTNGTGAMALCLAFDRVLSLAEYKILYDNPWIVFATEQDYQTRATASATAVSSRRKNPIVHPGAGPGGLFMPRIRTRRNTTATTLTTITGTAAITNANDTLAASGTPKITGSLATTNANDTLAAAGSPKITGTLATTNANDTLAAAGTPKITGTSATTNADDSLAASGTASAAPQATRRKQPNHPGKGPYNFTRFHKSARNTSIPSALGTITGSASITNADDTLAASGSPKITGTLATTNANDTLAAAGSPVAKGTLATTNANDTLAAAGTPKITGTLATTNANDTLAASGTVKIIGTAAITNANDTSAATGTPKITGTASVTNANDTLAASGTTGFVTGTANITNANDTLSAFGTAGTAPVEAYGWAGTHGERRTRKSDIDAILKHAEETAQEAPLEPVSTTYEAAQAQALAQDIQALQRQITALNLSLKAAKDERAVRAEISRITAEMEQANAALLALEIEDDNAAIALILGMVL